MIIVLIGKSGSGKTTIKYELTKYGFDTIKTCTTRKPRENETDYIFLSVDQFEDKIKNKEFMEYDYFNGSYYGSLLKDYTNNKVIVLTPNGYNSIKDKINCIGIYLYAEDSFLIERLLNKRNENREDIKNRLIADDKQFQSLKVDHIIYIENKEKDIIIKEILDIVKKGTN